MNVRWMFALLVAACLGAAALPAAANQSADPVVVSVLSGRADLVSGGDALVEVTVRAGADPRQLVVRAGSRDVSRSFVPVGSDRLRGLVTDLPFGSTVLSARLPDGSGGRLVVTNHPRRGPIFSGPAPRLWTCETETQGLGPSTPPFCETPTVVQYFSRTSDGNWASYDPDHPSEDVATTTTESGHTVPFIVRQEIGTMNRGIYAVAGLWDPKQAAPAWSTRGARNGKLLAAFDGGVSNVPRTGTINTITTSDSGSGETNPTRATNNAEMLGRGWVIAGHSHNRGQTTSDGVLEAESFMMVKERAIELFGPFRYTLGAGGSGGSANQNNITGAYPGLLDGVVLQASFLEFHSDTMQNTDWRLLYNYLLDNTDTGHVDTSPLAVTRRSFTPLQMAAVTGDRGFTTSTVGSNVYFSDPQQDSCDASYRYHPETKPEGYRCTLQDVQVNVFGQRPSSVWTAPERKIGRGFAPRMYDNVGVQYGLKALLAGEISAEQFVDLNESIGGYDIDFEPMAQRSVADPAALEIGYRTGRIPVGTHWTVPIIDLGGDEAVHPKVRSLNTRARVLQARGNLDNFILLGSTNPAPQDISAGGGMGAAIELMDKWLSSIEKDQRQVPYAAKVKDARPSAGITPEQYGDFSTARMAAGGPEAEDVQKCRLKPIRREDYASVAMTEAQLGRLRAAFPSGVCDWSRPGVSYRSNEAWITFADGPGGRPLGAAPVSEPFSGRGGGASGRTVDARGHVSLPATGGLPAGSAAVAAATLGLMTWRVRKRMG